MIGFLVLVTLAVMVIRWVVLHNRFHDLEQRIAMVHGFAARQSQVKELTDRLTRVELSIAELRMPAPPVVQRPEPVSEAPQPIVQPVMQPMVVPPPAEIPVFAPASWTRPAIIPPSAAQPAAPSSRDRLRAFLGNDEWEALLGGSLLNKVGAVVLVIGIALFLAYSFGRMSAAGRASLALSASATILGAGIWTERRAAYRLFARGLIGAGWAALYATAYAIYALPQARIIENPFVGSIGLLLVAAGMIGHSLRYRAQAVTATAYFAAFAALAATPSTPFAVVSLVPLAASLLYLANRFEWNSMALFGLAATYATCIARGSSDAALASTQSLFLAYWLLFEGFDLLRVGKRLSAGRTYAVAECIAPLNAMAFLALSYMAWSQKAPEMLWLAAAYGGALYLGDAVVRALLLPPSALEPDADLVARLRQGSYEFSLVLAAVLGGLAIVGKVPGVWSSVGLAVEAELLYLAGVRFRAGFMRGCGAAAFAFSLGSLATQESSHGQSTVLGHATWNWTPPALFHAFLFYVNRILKQPNALASSMAAALVAAVLAAEMPERYVGASWLLFALILLELGLRKRLPEFRLQAYTLAAAGAVASAYVHIASHVNMSWEGLALSLAAAYACALRSRWHGGALDGTSDGASDNSERDFFATGASAATAALAAILVWNTVPLAYVALAWILLALVLFEAGNRAMIRELRTMSWAVAAFGGCAMVGIHAEHFVKFAGVEVWASYLAACLAAWAMAARAVVWPPANLGAGERDAFADLMTAAGAFAAMAFVWLVLPDPVVTPAWAVLGVAVAELGVLASTGSFGLASFGLVGTAVLALTLARALTFDLSNAALWNGLSERVLSTLPLIAALYWMAYRAGGRMGRAYLWAASAAGAILIGVEMAGVRAPLGWTAFSVALLAAGLRFRVRDLRVQSYVLAVLAFPLALADTYPPQVAICAAIVAGFYAAEFLTARARLAGREHNAATMFSLFGTVLLAALLYGRVSGGLFTVALGLEGLALLGAGFPLRERILRLQGLALLLACILKLFLYDLRNLETIYRILSFIALGLIMLSVSWIYTRFREHVRQLL